MADNVIPFPSLPERQAMRPLPKLELVTATPVMPESADFYLKATQAQWEARMREKYGADFDGGDTV